MKIISWNVNGLRAVAKKDGWQEVFNKIKPDIFVIQETKCETSQIPEDRFAPAGYFSYFESAKNRKGYSGVAIYSKTKPIKITETLGDKNFIDNEGRTLVAEYEDFYLINCYFPNGGKSDEHFQYKLDYYDKMFTLMNRLEKKKPVIMTGDINATVADIDLARPKENAGKLGCTEWERTRLAQFCDAYIDTFRFINGEKVKYTWWDMKTRSRDRNIGWRIDYFFTSKSLAKKIKKAEILDEVLGSDHCPILLEIK